MQKKYILLSFVLFVINLTTIAQIFPVQVNSNIVPPYLPTISSYATTVNQKYLVNIFTADLTVVNRPATLKLYIEGNGIQAQSTPIVNGAIPIILNGGETFSLTNLDLAPYFQAQNLQGISPAQYANNLPQGTYNFCIEIYDTFTNQKISQKSCTFYYFLYNEPPLLNLPTNHDVIFSADPQNVIFTWTPRHINATNIEYEFTLIELVDATAPSNYAFVVGAPLYQTTTSNTILLLGPADPQLIAGRKYAWRVKAVNQPGFGEDAVFNNNGFSEIFDFVYAGNCTAPTFVISSSLSATQASINWQPNPDHLGYRVEYRKINTTEWFEAAHFNNEAKLFGLEPLATYEFRIGALCLGNQTTYSATNQFTQPAKSTVAINCGLQPAIDLTNQTLYSATMPQDQVFMAGDFPIHITEVAGTGSYTGKGWTKLPYFSSVKIEVEFKDIKINTNMALVDGVVKAVYDPTWSNIVNVNAVFDAVGDVIDNIDPLIEDVFGPQTSSQPTAETGNQDVANDNTSGNQNGNANNSGGTDIGNSTATPNTTGNPNNSATNAGNTTTTANNTGSTNNSSINNQNTAGNNLTGNDYFIEYKGQKYYDGGKIKIPYKRIMYETFEMKTLSDTTKVNFTIHEPGKQEMWRGYTGNSKKTTIPIEDITIKNNLRVHDLVGVAYKMNGKPKVRVEIEKVVPPFAFSNLKAIDLLNKSRVAEAGETLYYINKPTVADEYKKTEFKVLINPNLTINEIPIENIKWKLNNFDFSTGEGILGFSKDVNEKKDVKVTAISGFPNSISKNVNVKWVDEAQKQYSVVPPAIQSTAETVFNNLTKLNQILTNLGINNIVEIKPKISISGAQYNEIDKKTRHYNTIREGEINASVEVKASFNAPPPYSGKVKIPFTNVVLVDYALYMAFNLSLAVKGELRYEKREDKTEFINIENSICVKGSGGIEPGLKLNILPGQNNLVSVSGDAFGKAEITATGCYNITNNEFNPKVELTPLIVGFNLTVKTGGVSIFDNSYELSLSDKIKIYGQ